MLRYVFDPYFELHDIKQTGPYEITTRWTMVMKPTFNGLLRIKWLWDPTMIFTGASKMGVNPETGELFAFISCEMARILNIRHRRVLNSAVFGAGKFNSHIDHWDSLDNQQYLSLEGVVHMFAQLGSLVKVPDLETPKYTILRKKKEYEIRR